jgi:hypothetical protein
VREMLGEPRPSLRQLQAVMVQLAREGKIERDPPISEESVRGRNVRFRLRVAAKRHEPRNA